MPEKKPHPTEGYLRWCILGLAVLCAVLVALVYLRPGMNPYAYAPYAFYILQPDETTETPAENGTVTQCYSFTVPEGAKLRHGARLSIFLRHCYVKVYLDDELRYSSWDDGSRHIGKTPGCYWLTAAMRSDYAGKVLRIELTPVYRDIFVSARRWLTPIPEAAVPGQPQFLLIDHDNLLTQLLLPKEAWILFFGLFVLLSGLFLTLFSLIAHLEPAARSRLLCLGTLALVAALWNLCRLPCLLLALDVYGLQKAIWYLGSCAFLILPVSMLRFLSALAGQAGGRINRAASGISLGSAVVILLLQFLNLCDLHETLFWYGLLNVALVSLTVIAARPRGKELLWLLPFPLVLALDIVILRFSASGRAAVACLLWVALNLCIRGAGFVSEVFEREKQRRQWEKELYEARIHSLTNQIRPHFLYNTLSSVYVLCKKDAPRAAQVVEDFLDYLQSNLTALSEERSVPFSDELRHTKAYLAVESVRYEGLIHVEYDTPYTAFRLPPLTLQPIVENAVKHGIQAERFQLCITIRTQKTSDGTRITVEDNGPGFGAGNLPGSPSVPEVEPQAAEDPALHVGLNNVRDRLRLICGGTLSAAARPGGGTIVTILIPEGYKDSSA